MDSNSSISAITHLPRASDLYSVALHTGTMENWTYNPIAQEQTETYLKEICEAARNKLSNGAEAIDVVQFIVKMLEDHEEFNAGKGSAINEVGGHELEAAIVDGSTGAYEAIACAKSIRNPISAARVVLDSEVVCLLVGQAADDCARRAGLDIVDNEYFTTAKRLDHWKKWRAEQLIQTENLGTVGAIARDIYGNLAAAGSTGGNTCKPLGRVGDTAIIGAGLIANKNVAVACSGHGESILEANVAATVSSLVASGVPLGEAVTTAIQKVSQQSDGMPCAILAMDRHGRVYSQSTGRIFTTSISSSFAPTRASMSETTVAILEQHEFYKDGLLRAGLTRYCTMFGQCVLELQNHKELSTLDLHGLTAVFGRIGAITTALKHATGAIECGVVSQGGNTITLVPFGMPKEGDQSLGSQNGSQFLSLNPDRNLQLEASQLSQLHVIITSASPPLISGHTAETTQTLESRGEDSSWLIWENELHGAFLSPAGSVRGECILRPRALSGHEVFHPASKDSGDQHLVRAIYAVMQLLKSSLGITHCGIIIDCYAVGRGNVSLIPQPPSDSSLPDSISSPAAFCNTYAGYITSQLGPLAKEKTELLELAAKIRAYFQPPTLSASGSWRKPLTHSLLALDDPWYQAMFKLQDTFYHACIGFFRTEMSYDYVLSPVTSDCISSLMGLGSDSLPVQIPLHGRSIYLADSMQFTLEYMLRLKEGSRGMYYVSPSFRGEDPDSSHLNQFYHVECELEGSMDDGMKVIKDFVVSVAGSLFEKHGDLIRSIAGDTSHISNLLDFARTPGVRFPRVTFGEAMGICGNDSESWEFVVPKAPELGKKLTRKGERAVMRQYGGVVWLTMMIYLSVLFYQAYSDKTKTSAKCGDLLIGIGEMGGLGERHKTAEDVKAALSQHEVPLELYKWYVDLRDHNPMQSVGWGMGMKRFMLWLLKHDDVRDISVIPRLKTGAYLP